MINALLKKTISSYRLPVFPANFFSLFKTNRSRRSSTVQLVLVTNYL